MTLPDEVIEAGVKAWCASNAFTTTEAVVTAIYRAMSTKLAEQDDAVERVARNLHANDPRYNQVKWEHFSDELKEDFRKVARAALHASPGSGPAEGWREALEEIARDSNPDWTEKRVYPLDVLDDIHSIAVDALYPVTPTGKE